jgi:hypothetical protein
MAVRGLYGRTKAASDQTSTLIVMPDTRMRFIEGAATESSTAAGSIPDTREWSP